MSQLDLRALHPGLAKAAGSSLAALQGAFAARDLAPGETLYQEGAAGGGLCLVDAGRLAVTWRGQALGHATRGDLLGEFCITGGVATASVTAEGAARVFLLTDAALDGLASSAPGAASAVLEVTSRRLSHRLRHLEDEDRDSDEEGWLNALKRLLAPRVTESDVRKLLLSQPEFARLAEADLRVLDSVLWVRSFKPGQALVQQGRRDRDAWFIVEGEVVVERKPPKGEAVELARLGPGTWLGLVGLVEETPRTASVTATNSVRAANLSAAAFATLGRSPALKLALQRCIAKQLGADFQRATERLGRR